jgi:hypothetical protein
MILREFMPTAWFAISINRIDQTLRSGPKTAADAMTKKIPGKSRDFFFIKFMRLVLKRRQLLFQGIVKKSFFNHFTRNFISVYFVSSVLDLASEL